MKLKNKMLFSIITIIIFSCNWLKDNIDDKSKRNENWVWWIDAKTGKAGWIPVDVGEPVKSGRYEKFYFNGMLYCKGKLVAGNDVDTTFYFNLNGNLESYKIIKDSSLYFFNNGPVKIYRTKGNLSAEGIIQNHVWGNHWITYFDNGKPSCIKNLQNDTGWVTYYYNNGKVKDSDYTIGKEELPVRHFYDNGQLAWTNEFKNGKYNGVQKQYYPSGRLHAIGEYVDGKVTGENKVYFENGKIQAINHWAKSVYEGKQIAYYENGNIKVVVNCINGKKNGEGKQYDKNGKLILDVIYQDDVVVETKIKTIASLQP